MADFPDMPVLRTDKTDETSARPRKMKYWQTFPAQHRSRLRQQASASPRPTPSLDERLATYKAAKAQWERDIAERKQALEQYTRQRPAYWDHEWWPLSHALAWACCRAYAEASRLLAHDSSPSRMDLSVLNSNIRLGASLVPLHEAASMLFRAFKRGAIPVQANDGARRIIGSGEWVDYEELRAGSPTWDLRALDRSGQRQELRRIQVLASKLLVEFPQSDEAAPVNPEPTAAAVHLPFAVTARPESTLEDILKHLREQHQIVLGIEGAAGMLLAAHPKLGRDGAREKVRNYARPHELRNSKGNRRKLPNEDSILAELRDKLRSAQMRK